MGTQSIENWEERVIIHMARKDSNENVLSKTIDITSILLIASCDDIKDTLTPAEHTRKASYIKNSSEKGYVNVNLIDIVLLTFARIATKLPTKFESADLKILGLLIMIKVVLMKYLSCKTDTDELIKTFTEIIDLTQLKPRLIYDDTKLRQAAGDLGINGLSDFKVDNNNRIVKLHTLKLNIPKEMLKRSGDFIFERLENLENITKALSRNNPNWNTSFSSTFYKTAGYLLQGQLYIVDSFALYNTIFTEEVINNVDPKDANVVNKYLSRLSLRMNYSENSMEQIKECMKGYLRTKTLMFKFNRSKLYTSMAFAAFNGVYADSVNSPSVVSSSIASGVAAIAIIILLYIWIYIYTIRKRIKQARPTVPMKEQVINFATYGKEIVFRKCNPIEGLTSDYVSILYVNNQIVVLSNIKPFLLTVATVKLEFGVIASAAALSIATILQLPALWLLRRKDSNKDIASAVLANMIITASATYAIVICIVIYILFRLYQLMSYSKGVTPAQVKLLCSMSSNDVDPRFTTDIHYTRKSINVKEYELCEMLTSRLACISGLIDILRYNRTPYDKLVRNWIKSDNVHPDLKKLFYQKKIASSVQHYVETAYKCMQLHDINAVCEILKEPLCVFSMYEEIEGKHNEQIEKKSGHTGPHRIVDIEYGVSGLLYPNAQCYTRKFYVGGNGGRNFCSCGGQDGRFVTKVEFWCNTQFLRAIKVTYSDDTYSEVFGHRTNDNYKKTFDIRPGEVITELLLWGSENREIGTSFGGRTGRVQIQTNMLDTPFEAGQHKDDVINKTAYAAPVGSGMLAGISGRCGSDVDMLSFIFLVLVDNVSLTNVTYEDATILNSKYGTTMVSLDEAKFGPDNSETKWDFSRSVARTTTHSWSKSSHIEFSFGVTVHAKMFGLGTDSKACWESTETFEGGSEVTKEQTLSWSIGGKLLAGQSVIATASVRKGVLNIKYAGSICVKCKNGFTFDYHVKGYYKNVAYGYVETNAIYDTPKDLSYAEKLRLYLNPSVEDISTL